jgi:type I restriction enzyme S subunit
MKQYDNQIQCGLRFPEFQGEGEWEVKRLGEILTVNSGKDYKHLNPGNIPVYGTGGYMLSVNDKLSDIDAIGIGRKGTIDKPQYLKAPFWTVDTLFFLTTKEGYDLKFVYCLLQTIDWKKYAEQTGVPSLTRSSIEKIEVKVPPLTEQQKIAQSIFELDELIKASNEKLELLKAHKKGLMQQLFLQHRKYGNK